GGGGSARGSFAPPPNSIGWMPTLDLPTWVAPPAFVPPPAFEGIGDFHYDPYAAPAPYVPGTFNAPTIEEARNEPGFQFALQEGRRQMEASAAAKGIGRTGGAVKHLIGYGQNMADTNYQNVYNRNKSTFDTNEGNRAGAYKTNADIGYQAWSGNQDNALDTFTSNYNTARDRYTTGYTTAKDLWQTAFDSAVAGHTARTNELIGEFAPKQQEAVITHQQAFAEWLAKMGIAQNIFNEGSD
ncbi:MAG TPA: hypothetical protein VN759_09255, partial [Pseudolysinimonas sp.]|nr:hypothetical protein [Pseudolysinimonas sp.]